MKFGLVLVALAVVSVSAACGPATAGSGKSEAEHKFTVSEVKDPKLVLGDTATTTEEGNTLTVLSYETPLSLKGAEPDPGSAFSAIEVRGATARLPEGI